MKKIFCLFLFATLIAIANATATPTIKINAAEPSATLQKMWVDYNAIEDGRAGMMMHLDFTIYNMKGKECFLGLYFQYNNGKPENWIKFPGKYDKYHATDGTLHRGVTYTPSYDEAVYKDIQLFMPYDEIKLDPGTYDLAISPQVAIKNGKNIAWFDLYEFEFNKADDNRGANSSNIIGKKRVVKTTAPRAVFDTLWADFDVKENNELGMNIHFKFVTYNMKDTQASVAIYFLYNTYEMKSLKDKNQKFLSGGGNVALYMDINPGYDTAYYNDLVLFMPYAELDLTPGTYELLMDTKVIHRRGGLISNFIYQPFRYTEPAR